MTSSDALLDIGSYGIGDVELLGANIRLVMFLAQSRRRVPPIDRRAHGPAAVIARVTSWS
jgi:hypothetical protein